MDTEEADLNPTPAQTDSAQTSESVEISKSENRIEKDPSYMRSRQIANSLRYPFKAVISSSGLVTSVTVANRNPIHNPSVYLRSALFYLLHVSIFQHTHNRG
jgi:hypothetical protein